MKVDILDLTPYKTYSRPILWQNMNLLADKGMGWEGISHPYGYGPLILRLKDAALILVLVGMCSPFRVKI